jgi:hypothetical protein
MKHTDSRPVRPETKGSEDALKPRAVKVSGETYARLYRFMGALQMQYGEKVSADEAIAALLELEQDKQLPPHLRRAHELPVIYRLPDNEETRRSHKKLMQVTAPQLDSENENQRE